ncbi:MAG: carboxypeptidase regulatory-like domain-containing protein [Muribaculaceae bacterium]|nr:carboxypeptidase regulatory-like domain-containing protein [Muribaculaceae bacterium]
MRPKHTFILSVTAVSTIMLSTIMGATREPGLQSDIAPLKRVVAAKEAPALPEKGLRHVTHDGFFYEDFESMKPGVLDSGWTTLPTPGHPSDTWSVATLGTGDENIVQGISGMQYAYILGNRNPDDQYGHDAWLFSPKVKLKAGQEYKIEFFAQQHPGYTVGEIVNVYVMREASPDQTVQQIAQIEDNTAQWVYYPINWTPEEDGEYCLGFHNVSPYMTSGTIIDDVRVSSGPLPSYLGAGGVNMGETDLVAGTFTASYEIENRGNKEMVVDLISSSPEVRVIGLPVTVEPMTSEFITIEFTPTKVGPYVGNYVLSTTDPSHPEVELLVVSNVRDVPVRSFHEEDFEDGGPKGWSLSMGAVNTDAKGGHNGPRSFYLRSFYTTLAEVEAGFTTHYCNMGDNPELSLWYKLISCDLLGQELDGLISSEIPILDIYVSDDMGKNWTPVYSMQPGTDTAHKPSADFQEIKVPLPEYANKCCRVKTVLRHAGSPLKDDFILLIDDVAIGTRPGTDLKASGLYGNSTVTINEPQEVSLTVTNFGSSESGNYTVELSDENGNQYASQQFSPLASGATAQQIINWTPTKTGTLNLNAKIISGNDEIDSNNVSNTLHLSVVDDNHSGIEIGKGKRAFFVTNPIDFNSYESLVQNMYYANELGIDGGDIHSITFWSEFSNPYKSENFEVYVAETDRQDFSNSEILTPSEFVKVFSGDVYMAAGEYKFTIPFDKPFKYNGGNLVVMTYKCSNEFIVTKPFLVHFDDAYRSISGSATEPGTLLNGNPTHWSAGKTYAHAEINIVKAPHGEVAGVVRNTAGELLNDVKVAVEGTQLFTNSGKDGSYSFAEVRAGNRALSASKYGYYPSSGNSVNVAEGSKMNLDITLTPYPQVSLRGKVTTEGGEPIEGAKVILEGYAGYSALTDAEGNYEIKNVYGDTGEEYTLRIEALHFNTLWKYGYQIPSTDTNFDAVLKADVQPPFKVVAELNDNALNLSWEHPLVEFKHDNGIPNIYLGWYHGHARAAVFTTYRQKILVKQIKFYLSDANGPHDNINVFITKLDAKGHPDPSQMLYLAERVPFADNAWTTVILDEPIEVENFALGISGAGYIGLGASQADESTPFEDLMHFWAADDMYNPTDMIDFNNWTDIHPMLRVYGDYLGNPATDPLHESLKAQRIKRPDTAYDVYRIEVGANDMKNIGSTTGTFLTDDGFAQCEDKKKYQYAVVAKYGDLQSEATLSNVVFKSSASIGSAYTDIVEFGPNPLREYLKVKGHELVKEIRLYSVDGQCMKLISKVEELNDVSNLQPGIYVTVLTCTNGSLISQKMHKK